MRGHQQKLLQEVKELRENVVKLEQDVQHSKEVERQRSRDLLKAQEEAEKRRHLVHAEAALEKSFPERVAC